MAINCVKSERPCAAKVADRAVGETAGKSSFKRFTAIIYEAKIVDGNI
jgi:hypothetical protein